MPQADLELSLGLVENHAYALLSAIALESGARLVRVRNPWGATEWKGAWSDGAAEWTDAVKEEVQRKVGGDGGGVVQASQDGAFWMAFEDWAKYFGEVCSWCESMYVGVRALGIDALLALRVSGVNTQASVCYIHDGWSMNTLHVELRPGNATASSQDPSKVHV